MNRCAAKAHLPPALLRRLPALALCCGLIASLGLPAGDSWAQEQEQAQAQRRFTAQTLRGQAVFGLAPELLLNRQATRLAPGAVVRGVDNMAVLAGALMGQSHWVHYTLDLHGQLDRVWILSASELARRPWPSTLEELNTWQFDPASQTWSKP